MSAYRLQPLHDQRARDERAKRGDLADAVGDARTAEAALATTASRVTNLREAIGLALAEPTLPASAAELVRVERHVEHLRHQLELAVIDALRAQDAVAGRQTTIDMAKQRLALARAARRAAEAHFLRWRDEQHKLAERRQD